MTKILTWAIALFSFLPARVLGSLGFGWLSYAAFDNAVNAFISNAVGSVNSIGGIAYNILSMAGFIDAFGIILGAIAARSVFVFADKFSRLILS